MLAGLAWGEEGVHERGKQLAVLPVTRGLLRRLLSQT